MIGDNDGGGESPNHNKKTIDGISGTATKGSIDNSGVGDVIDDMDDDGNNHGGNNPSVPTCSLLTCSFNQDGGCLAIGTSRGFSVHNLFPQYAVSVRRDLSGGIGLVEMLFRCNLMAIVGGGTTDSAGDGTSGTGGGGAYAPSHRVLIWDDHIPKEIGELSFRQTVLAVKLRKDSIAVALRDRVYVYHLADLSLRDKIYTADNPFGLLCLSTQIHDMVLACPSVTNGHVRCELYGLRKTILMEAHETALRQIALTADGSKLATSSTKGTVIRIWDVQSGTCIQQFRRGVERATITCLCWSWDYAYLGCTSDKGTAHVFQLSNEYNTTTNHHHNNNNNPYHNNGNINSNGYGRQYPSPYGNNNNHNNGNNIHSITTTTTNNLGASHNKKKSFTKRLFSSVKKTVLEGDAHKKSIARIHGVPHPQACAFVSEATPNQLVLAVAGYDADGNGVLLLSEVYSSSATASSPNHHHHHHNGSNSDPHHTSSSSADEPKRLGYHVICKSPQSLLHQNETEEERRRRRLRGYHPNHHQNSSNNNNDGTPQNNNEGQDHRSGSIDANENSARLLVGDRIDVLEGQKMMQQIQFNESQEDEFVTVTTTINNTNNSTSKADDDPAKNQDEDDHNNNNDPSSSNDDATTKVNNNDDDNQNTPTTTRNTLLKETVDDDHNNSNSNGGAAMGGCSSTFGDSIRTESLGDGTDSRESSDAAVNIAVTESVVSSTAQ